MFEEESIILSAIIFSYIKYIWTMERLKKMICAPKVLVEVIVQSEDKDAYRCKMFRRRSHGLMSWKGIVSSFL